MNVNSVDAAEKEASEVLHSLLSVERIEKPIHRIDGHMQQVVVLDCQEDGQQRVENGQEWGEPIHNTVFSSIEQPDSYQNNVWEGTLSLDDQSLSQEQTLELLQPRNNGQQNMQKGIDSMLDNKSTSSHASKSDQVKKSPRKKYRKVLKTRQGEHDSEDIEASAQEVRARFKLGCECHDDCCFKGLSAESVYKHRLNIAELTKEEHDMYLMGVTMACMTDPGVTAKQKLRRRLRVQYVYQGRRVCLSAFLYLENCTLYQLKRIRKHVMTHGVAPRVHGNHGKKPHNVFPLDTYRRATEFLKSYIEKYNNGSSNLKSPILFPPEISRKAIHNMYTQMMQEIAAPGQKILGYTTFRHFMKEQFPQVRFCKQDSGPSSSNTSNSSNIKHNANNSGNNIQQQQQSVKQQQNIVTTSCITNSHPHELDEHQTVQEAVITQQPTNPLTSNTLAHSAVPVSVASGTLLSPAQMATIPVILSEPSKPAEIATQQTAFIVTPVSQLVQPFQSGHAITVTPITNTAYAFTTL